jgi:hypothetical protein
MPRYDLVSSANDALTTVTAKTAKDALKLWKFKLWVKHPMAKGVRAILVRGSKKNPTLRGRKRNPISTISGSGGGGWLPAHAYRKLPDGRVQILTNPKGKVSPKIKIVKRNRGK